jgi:N utilization substance protein B
MSKKKIKSSGQSRSTARLAAVQALYDADITGDSVEILLKDFIDHAIGGRAIVTDADDETETEVALAAPDPLLLAAILRGSLAQAARLDEIVANALSGDWHIERLEAVLRAILRAAAFELTSMPDTPVRVVISEYVDIAGAFYAGPEPGLVNAVLDRIARVVRAEELSGRPKLTDLLG